MNYQARRIDNNEWVYGGLVCGSERRWIVDDCWTVIDYSSGKPIEKLDVSAVEVIPETVRQIVEAAQCDILDDYRRLKDGDSKALELVRDMADTLDFWRSKNIFIEINHEHHLKEAKLIIDKLKAPTGRKGDL